MKEHDFSQLVVQDQKGTHRLITREGIAKWLEESIEDDVVSIRETTIEQVLRCEDKEACCFLLEMPIYSRDCRNFQIPRNESRHWS